MLSTITGYCSCLSLVYIQDGVLLAEITEAVRHMEYDSDVIALSISLIAGGCTEQGVATVEADLSAIARPTFVSLVDFLNTTFKMVANLKGEFRISRGVGIYYSNPERFTAASNIVWDMGGFSGGFGGGFN